MGKSAPPALDVKRLRFAFDQTWDEAFVWDESQEFIDGLRRLNHTHGVDIVGRRLQSQLWLIEVKDPRGHQLEYRQVGEDPALLTAEKTRDTIAGILWAIDRFPGDRVRRLAQTLLATRRDGTDTTKVIVVLWLEGIGVAEASAYTTRLERLLKWLNPTVIVTDRRLWDRAARRLQPGLEVVSLPGAPVGTTR